MSDFFESMDSKREKTDIVKRISSIPSNYVGSKRRLLSHIYGVLEDNNVKFDSVFDAFSGSAMVSLLFKFMGKRVFCNDLLTSSAITAVSLLENNSLPITRHDLNYLCKHDPTNCETFVLDNYKDKFFTENECKFLDRYRTNVKDLFGEDFYRGMHIPTSKISAFDNQDNGIKCAKYQGTFALFAIENHVNQNCFLGGRYYNGQTIAKLEHRLVHQKSNGREITDIPVSIDKFKKVCNNGKKSAFNSDIIELLMSEAVEADLIYLDPPYGGGSSDYSNLYRFLEEYLYGCKLEDMEHLHIGSKRFTKSKGYKEQFKDLLELCGKFKTWMISYNESSFSDIDTIVSIIKEAGRSNVQVFDLPITYQYRKGKNIVETEIGNYADSGHVYSRRGTEFLILARD